MNYFSSNFKLGIVGGGQLGKMLLTETQKLDIQTYVLDPNDEAPCRIACNHFTQGDLMDFNSVFNFGKDLDLVTIEIENVNTDALEALEKKGVKVYPSSKTLKRIQNKVSQKLFYTDNNIPTASYSRFAYTSEIKEAINNGGLKLPFVWKSAKFGYDGKGVKIVRQQSDLNSLPNTECIAEELVNFKHELAVIVARNVNGELASYPVVEMEFHPEANQVEYVLCPARIPEALAQKAQRVALQTSKAYNHVGLLAVELFATQNDTILVNEVAPRPHNSGHYSIEGSFTSQYEQHLRAILNLPLGSTDNKLSSVMVNLVGEAGYSGPVIYKNIEKIFGLKGVTPHIYGKRETRPFRKMGHITIISQELEQARALAEEVKQLIKVISNE